MKMQQAIEAWRIRNKMTKQQTAWDLGITPGMYSHFLAGRRTLSHRSRAIACHKMGIDPVVLLPVEEMK